MPTAWNGSLLIFAHGYVDTTQPLGIPEDQLVLPDGTSIPDLINSLGYAFAVSGYSVNGLAVLQGISDSADLVNIFTTTVGQPKKVLIAGPSEGGLVTALSVERYPNIYNGGLAACGPGTVNVTASGRPATTSTPGPTIAPGVTPLSRSGRFAGPVIMNPFGNVQVAITVTAGRITAVATPQLPGPLSRSVISQTSPCQPTKPCSRRTSWRSKKRSRNMPTSLTWPTA